MMHVSEHIAYEAVGEQVVLLDLNAGRYFSLDGSGARIWQLLTQGLSQTAIVEQLHIEYDASEATLQSDVASLMQDLLQRGLVAHRAKPISADASNSASAE